MTHEARRAPKVHGTAAIHDVPAGLYEQSRRRLLENEPLRDHSSGSSVAGALTAGEAAALQSVGLSIAPFAAERAQDPLMQSIADYMALLETSFTTSEAAKYLKVDVSRIRQRLRERTLFGIDYDGERRLPRFQFERKQVLPGLREVIAALPEALNPLDVAQWFLAPNPDLEIAAQDTPLSPRDWLLRANPVDAVVASARGFE
ncbi:MAG: DNA-binding protein [Steroidobacteraceae bacterium]